jgi:hypothetical protein
VALAALALALALALAAKPMPTPVWLNCADMPTLALVLLRMQAARIALLKVAVPLCTHTRRYVCYVRVISLKKISC